MTISGPAGRGHHPRGGVEAQRQLPGIVHRAEVVREEPAVGGRWGLAQARGSQRRQRVDAEGDGGVQGGDRLVRRGDHHEAGGGRRDDLLTRVGAPAALDQP